MKIRRPGEKSKADVHRTRQQVNANMVKMKNCPRCVGQFVKTSEKYGDFKLHIDKGFILCYYLDMSECENNCMD